MIDSYNIYRNHTRFKYFDQNCVNFFILANWLSAKIKINKVTSINNNQNNTTNISTQWPNNKFHYYIPELIPLYFTIRGNRAINLWTAQYELHDCRPPKGPPYTMTPTNDGRVRQRLLIRCYSYGHGYVNNQTVFGRDKLPKNVFWGFYRA